MYKPVSWSIRVGLSKNGCDERTNPEDFECIISVPTCSNQMEAAALIYF